VKTALKPLSSFLANKGPCCEPTFRAFTSWNLDLSQKENLKQIEESNSVGAASNAWLQQLIRVLKQRYDTDGADRTLVQIAHSGWQLDEWLPVQLWHMARSEELFRYFLVDCLFDLHQRSIVRIDADVVVEYLQKLVKARLGSIEAWTPSNYRHVANALLKSAVDFRLLKGRLKREFENYRMPDRSFIYLLHKMMSQYQSTRKMVEAPEWRFFLLKPGDVEEELLRLHQYGKLRFERAGSFLELTLPHHSIDDFLKESPR